MLRLDDRQRRQDLGKVQSQRRLGSVRVASVDGRKDRAVLRDKAWQRRCRRQREMADPVHVGLDVAYDRPCRWASGPFGKGRVEGFVRLLEL